MRIAVIAANGRSGQAFVAAALAAGHVVRAGVHGRHTLPDNHPNLTIITCDASNVDDLSDLFRDCDAVASFIGHIKGSEPDIQTKAITNAVEAMNIHGVKRIVSLTGTGVRMPDDRITLIDRVLNRAISIIDPERVHDGVNHVKILQDSDLDWTVLRVLKLQNIAPRPSFTLTASGPTKTVVSRSDVALATLQIIENDSFIRQAPMISNK